jgi:collagen triple helix repeat protein
MKKLNLITLAVLFVFTVHSCKTGKKAYQKGNYYQSVIQSVQKLRKSPNNKKAMESLREAYPLAIQTLELNTENLKASNDPSKWKLILANYNKINTMYEEILRSPAALKIIPKPKNYYTEIENVKKNAAQETYARALELLNRGTRQDAIMAYQLFDEVQSYIANYKDSLDKKEEARVMATIYVMVKQDPVPANFAVSGKYFRNKIDEYLHASESRINFIEFYTPEELVNLGIQPDHEITLRYMDFSIGNVYFKESSEQLTKDSVIVATIKAPIGTPGKDGKDGVDGKDGKDGKDGVDGKDGADGKDGKDGVDGKDGADGEDGEDGDNDDDNDHKIKVCHRGNTLEISQSALQAHLDHGDVLGSCDDDDDDIKAQLENIPEGYIPVYATVKATLTTYEKTITSKALLSMTITDVQVGRVLKEELLPAEYVWVSKWGTFNGDERALSSEQLELCQQKEKPAPSRDDTFNFLSEQFYKEVTQNIRTFYQKY